MHFITFLLGLACVVGSATAQGKSPMLALPLVKTICSQQNAFRETGKIQAPVKTRAESSSPVLFGCIWYEWNKRASTFTGKSCESVGVYNTGTQNKQPKAWCGNQECRSEVNGCLPNHSICGLGGQKPCCRCPDAGIEPGDVQACWGCQNNGMGQNCLPTN